MAQASRSSERPTRVLFVSGTLSGGGAERFVSTALQRLDRARFEPRLCLLRREIGYPLPDDVPLHVVGKRRPWSLPVAIVRLARSLDAERPDVVLSAFFHPSFVVGNALLLCRHRPRWIARVSIDPDYVETGARRPWMRALYRRADRVLVNSRGLCEAFARAYPSVAARSHHLPNACDFERIDALAREAVGGSPRRRPTLVAVGRLARQKRLDLLLDAVSRLRGRFDLELVVCGEGPLRERLRAQAARLGLERHVRLEGFCPNPYAWMARADLYVLSSDHEGLPNALIEAQGLGLAAVASDCRFGPGEVIAHGETGLLVPTGDAGALADALASLLSNPERRRGMGEAARARVRSLYAAGPVVRRLEEHLEGREAPARP